MGLWKEGNLSATPPVIITSLYFHLVQHTSQSLINSKNFPLNFHQYPSSSTTALQWLPLKFSCFLEPLIQHKQADFSEAVTWAPRRRGEKSEVSPRTQGALRDGAWGEDLGLTGCREPPGARPLAAPRSLPTVATPGDAADDLPLRMLFCRPAREQLLTCLLAVAQNMFVPPAASPPSMGKESGICICAPRPFIPLPTHHLQGQQVSVKAGNSHRTLCPQTSFFFHLGHNLGRKQWRPLPITGLFKRFCLSETF